MKTSKQTTFLNFGPFAMASTASSRSLICVSLTCWSNIMVMYHFCYLVPQVAYEGGNDTLLIGPRLVSNGLLLVYEGFMVLFRVLVVLIVTPCVPVLVFIPMVIIGLEPSGVLFEAVELKKRSEVASPLALIISRS